jgi:hypothetical protein
MLVSPVIIEVFKVLIEVTHLQILLILHILLYVLYLQIRQVKFREVGPSVTLDIHLREESVAHSDHFVWNPQLYQ